MNWESMVESMTAANAQQAASQQLARSAKKRKPAVKKGSEDACITSYLKHGKVTAPRTVSLKGESNADGEAELVLDESMFEIKRGDVPEVKVAKSLLNLMANDLRTTVSRGSSKVTVDGDLFSFEAPDHNLTRLYSALSWVYAFQRAGGSEEVDGKVVKDAMVPFEWACQQVGWDPELFRRVLGRVVRPHLSGLLRTISEITSDGFTRECEVRLSEYVEVSGWRMQ